MLFLFFLLVSYGAAIFLVDLNWGSLGLWGRIWSEYLFVKILVYVVIVTHVTITCMSLSFHRYHTHRGVILNKVVDFMMQTWLWLITGMSKLDWVSIHLYHHAHSDKQKDPHSPVQKGFWRVFILGVYDYVIAKDWKPVQRIRNRLARSSFETFYDKHSLLGPILFTCFNLIAFGPFYGSLINVLNFLISPLFAVGGVNALAHMWGYRNHQSGDNSRNIGFLYLLNWMICGELDHNNHHAHQKSCSFRHRWFEFDIGYVYIVMLSWLGLAEIKVAYRPENLKDKMRKELLAFLENETISQKLEKLASEINQNYEELKGQLVARIQGEQRKLEPALENVIRELKVMLKEASRFHYA